MDQHAMVRRLLAEAGVHLERTPRRYHLPGCIAGSAAGLDGTHVPEAQLAGARS